MASAVTQILSSAASGITPPQTGAQVRGDAANLTPAQIIQASQKAAELKSAETRKVVPKGDQKRVDKSPNQEPKRRVPGKKASEEEKEQGEDEAQTENGRLNVVA